MPAEDIDPLQYYHKKHNFEDALTLFKEKFEFFYSCGHRGTGARCEAWAHLFSACQKMSGGFFVEALDLLGPSLVLFQSLQPPDNEGKRICEARMAEVKGLIALKDGENWEAKRCLVEAKAIYIDKSDAISARRTVLAAALATGHDLSGKGDLCFGQGEFKLAATAFHNACTAYLQSNIHDKDQPTTDPLAVVLKKRIQASVAVCVSKRQKAQTLAGILDNAESEEEAAEKSADVKEYAAAFDMKHRAAILYEEIGGVYLDRAVAAREHAEVFQNKRLKMTEESVLELMRSNDYGGAANAAIPVCKEYATLANNPKKKTLDIAKDYRLGHIRTTAMLLEIVGTQSWWLTVQAAGDAIPRLTYAFPGLLLERGAAGSATQGITSSVGRTEPGRALADKVSVMLYDHQKRTERRGYEQEMLFGEAARLLAVSGKQQEGLRMQYFRWVQKGFSDWMKGNMESCAQAFSAAADLLHNVYNVGTGGADGPTEASLHRATLTIRSMIRIAQGKRILEQASGASSTPMPGFSDPVQVKAKEEEGVGLLDSAVELLQELLESQKDIVGSDTNKGLKNFIFTVEEISTRVKKKNQWMMSTNEDIGAVEEDGERIDPIEEAPEEGEEENEGGAAEPSREEKAPIRSPPPLASVSEAGEARRQRPIKSWSKNTQ